MEYWESKTDEDLILVSDPCHHHKIRSHSAIDLSNGGVLAFAKLYF